jgi:hypothetical protein
MTDLIERVAKAIYEDRNGAGCMPWGRRDEAHKEPYRSDARAAIEAMREPTEEMGKAGADHVRNVSGGMSGIYRAMIDAALGGRDE